MGQGIQLCSYSLNNFLRIEIEGEIRITVDELMREELKNLKMAVERDKGKGKKGKKGKKKKKKVSINMQTFHNYAYVF